MWERRKLLGRDFARSWSHRHSSGGGGHPRPRVLIEEPDVAEAFAYSCLLEDNGYEVLWCPGPAGPPPRRCPLVACGQCDLVRCADVVISSLELDHESSRKVVSAHRYLHPETPVVIQAPQQVLAQWAPVFEGRWGAIRIPVTKRTLLDSVEFALAKSAADAHEDEVGATYVAPMITERVRLSVG